MNKKILKKIQEKYKGMGFLIESDLSEILGASDSTVMVRGYTHDLPDDKFNFVVIAMPIFKYLQMVHDIIKDKQKYFKSWGHFCGNFMLCVEEYVIEDYTTLNEWSEKLKDTIVHTVPIVWTEDFIVDMEHG